MSKRIIAILLAAMMLFSLMPTMAFAEEENALSEEVAVIEETEAAAEETAAAEPDTYTLDEDGDVSAEEETGIDADSIENIVFEDLTVIEGTHGYYSYESYWDYELQRHVETPLYYRYCAIMYGDIITVYFKDGTVEQYEAEAFKEEFECWEGTDQRYGNQWGVGEHQIAVFVNGKEYTRNITITESPIENVVFTDAEVIEGTNGYYTNSSYWNDELQEWLESPEYYCYNVYGYCSNSVTATVYFKNGTENNYPLWEFLDNFGTAIDSDQSYENQWGLGEHQFRIMVYGAAYTLNYTVVEDPIEEIVVEDIVTYEGCNGFYERAVICGEGGNTQKIQYFNYDIIPEEIVIKFKDGSEKTCSYNELENEFYEVWFSDDQSYENQWGVGNHTVSLYADGRETSYNFIVEESPVERITAPDIYIVKNTRSWNVSDSIFDSETGEWIGSTPNYALYDIYCEEITVYFKDGRVETKNGRELYTDYSAEILVTDDQSYDNQWGIGRHTAKVNFMGKTADINVFIRETPVKSIKASPVVIYEGEHKGPALKEWCDEDGVWQSSWYEIYSDYYPEEVTIEFVDGSEYTCSVWMLSSIAGCDFYISDDQAYDNEWGLGKHTATLHFMDATADFEVSIVESPVESIEISDIRTVENHGGHDDGYGYVYDVRNTPITINYKDGTTETYANLYDAEGMTGHSIREDACYDHETGESAYPIQDWVNVWEAGTHQVCMEFCGVTDVYNVVIESESPVESLSVNEPIRIIEGVAGTVAYVDDNDELQYRYYYDRNPSGITVNYKDGSSATYAWDEIQEKTGYLPVCNCVTDAELGNWTAGEHITTVEFAGAVCECPVIIEDNGVASIEAEDVTIPAKTDCGIVFSYDLANDVGITDYYYFDIAPSEITVTYKDGHVEKLDKERLNSDWTEKGIGAIIPCGQDKGEYWDVGTYEVSITYLGKSATYNITITDECDHNYVDGVCTHCGAKDPDYKPPVQENPFVDVSETAVYYDAVLWASNEGITSGYGNNDFRPQNACTRAQVVTFLWRAMGSPEPMTTDNPFSDVSAKQANGKDNPYYKAILWAAEKGITTGYDGGLFKPNDTVTRGQFVTFLWRAEGKPATAGSINGFADAAKISAPFQQAVAWAVEKGITTGYNDNTFRPNDACTRWAVVLFMFRDMA